ncbi:helix-turn-helix domain-containing protein [Aquisphaera giovannonii]|nr:hypothetical protein [Aquisphaera giovannonii]
MGRTSGAETNGAAARRSASSGGGSTKRTPAGEKNEEAIEAMRSGEPTVRQLTVRTYKADFTTREYGPDDVRRMRGLLGMSQAVFASSLGVEAGTVRPCKQGNRPPSAMVRRFLGEIEGDPTHWRGRVVESDVGGDETGPAS